MNKIKPGSIPKINEGGATFKLMENVQNFQKALKDYGVPDIDVFQTVDLFEKKDIAGVTNTFFALGRAVWKDPKWSGPKLGPKPADLNERDFTEEQLKAGQTIVGLQAGQNKGNHFQHIKTSSFTLLTYACFSIFFFFFQVPLKQVKTLALDAKFCSANKPINLHVHNKSQRFFFFYLLSLL